MKIVLTSHEINIDAVEYLESTLNKKAKDISVAMIPTAKNHRPKDYFEMRVRQSLDKAKSLGLKKIKIIDIEGENKESLRSKLGGFDVILILGGNTFYLLDKARKSGFGIVLKELLNKGKICVGISAGDIILGPNIEIADNDFCNDPDIVGLKDRTGLGIIHFTAFPHYKNEFRQKLQRLIKGKGVKYPIYTIKDGQTIIYEGDKLRFIGGKPEVF